MADANIKDWNILSASNTGANPEGAPENMPRSDVNNVMREMMGAHRRDWTSAPLALGGGAWRDPTEGITPSFISASSLRIPGIDLTHCFPPNRKIRIQYADGNNDGYCFVDTSAFTGGNTDLTVEDFDDVNPDDVVRNVTITRVSFYSAFGGSSLHELGRGAFEGVGGNSFVVPLVETAAGIQAALTLAASENKIVLLKNTAYSIENEITVPTGSVIRGTRNTTLTLANSLNKPFFRLADSATDIELSGFEMKGNASNQSALGQGVQFGEGNERVFISNLYIRFCWGNGIDMGASVTSYQNILIDNCFVEECGKHCIIINYPSVIELPSIYLSNVTLKNPATNGAELTDGCCLTTAAPIQVSNISCDISVSGSDTGAGIRVTGAGVIVSGFRIFSNIGSNHFGIDVSGENSHFSDGIIEVGNNVPLRCSSNSNRFTNLHFHGGNEAVEITGTYNDIVGCMFDVFSQQAMKLLAGADHNNIRDNVFTSSLNGIDIAATCKNNIVLDNLFNGVYTTSIVDAGDQNGLGVTFTDKPTEQSNFGINQVAVAGLTGINFPLPPNGARRFKISCKLSVNVVGTTTINVKLHAGVNGVFAGDVLFTTVTRTNASSRDYYLFELGPIFFIPTAAWMLSVSIQSGSTSTCDVYKNGENRVTASANQIHSQTQSYVLCEYVDG